MNKIYIKLDETGWLGKKPWQTNPFADAYSLPTMKDARRYLNRLRDRLGFPRAEIVVIDTKQN